MKYRITWFALFLSIVFGLIVGVYKYSFLTNVLYYIIFFVLVIFSYRIYLIFERLGVFLYEKYFKKIYENVKKTKETMQK